MAAPLFTLKVGDGLGAHIGAAQELFKGATAIISPNIKDGDLVPVDGKLRVVPAVTVTLDNNGKINGNTGIELLANDPSLGLDNPLQWTISIKRARRQGFTQSVKEWTIQAGEPGSTVDLAQVPPVVGVPGIGARGARTKAVPVNPGDPDTLYQWVDEFGNNIGDPVPFSGIVPEAVAEAAAAAVATGVVDANIAGRQVTVVDAGGGAGQITIGGVPAGSPITHLPGNVWSGVAGRDEGVKKATGGIVPIEKFNPDAGFASALSAAIDEADANGGTVVLEAGKTYTANAAVSKTDKHVRINFNGARIIRSAAMANASVLTLTYSTSTIQDVTGLTDTAYDWGTGSSTYNTLSTRIAVANASGWSKGDWATIVCEDPVPGGIPEEGKKEGERFRVAGVQGNWIFPARRLRINPTTGIRIARMTRRDVILNDPWIEDQAGSPNARKQSVIDIVQAVQPVINRAKCFNLMGTGIRLAGCVQGMVDEVEVYNLRTSVADDAYGYGVLLVSCCDFTITVPRGGFFRNLIATGGSQSPPALSTDLWRYGSNIGHRTIGGTAHDAGASAFSTHDEAAHMLYQGCFVGWSHRANETSYRGGIHLRGRENIAKDCTTIGHCGIWINGAEGGGNHKAINHTHSTPPGYTFAGGAALLVDYAGRTTRGKAEVSGQWYVPNHQSGAVVQVGKSILEIPYLKIVSDTVQDFAKLFDVTDSEVRIGTLEYDLTGSTANAARIFSLWDDTCVVKADRLIVRAGGYQYRLADFNSKNATLIVGRLECDTLPIAGGTGVTGAGATAVVLINDVSVNGASVLAAVDPRADANATLTAFAASTQLLDTPLTGTRSLTEPTAPVVGGVGRTIRYIRSANATGAFSWTIGTDSLTTAGTWLERMWSGTAWVTVEKGRTGGGPRIASVTSNPTPAINVDRTDQYNLTAQAAAITGVTINGTPADGQELWVRVTALTSNRAITWGANFVGTLLTTALAGKTHFQRLRYDAAAAKWVGVYADTTGY